ncbi:Flp pilus assembly protein CpaB [uncultured Rhodospira sp.]|uniref:Flp pilus assembly protein CpaB n=1 Tax=uncultured Rhodospira sp. TaxID=1936189 RepID=UPI0026106C11|nr:Flp pilus assembly protein CpaB [uncultured Rhodospira sp.]
MRTVLLLVLTIAVAAAGGAAYLVNQYLVSQRQQAAEATPDLPVFSGQKVLVADRVIEPGVPLRASAFRWQPWPAEDILPSYKVIGAAEGLSESALFDQRTRLEGEMTGKVTRRTIAAGEPITDTAVFSRDNASFMAGALNPGMRAVSIPVNATSGAAGFILPGDRVDVILTHDVRDSMPRNSRDIGADTPVSRFMSETILESVRVLAVDQTFHEDDEEPKVVDTVTVEVTAAEAEKINLATQMGIVSLALRALSDRQAPVGLASLLGVSDGKDAADRPLVSDRSVSGGLDLVLRTVLGPSDLSEEERRLREAEEEARRRAAELEAELARVRDAAARRAAEGWPQPDTGPEWKVTVYTGGEDPRTYQGANGNGASSAPPAIRTAANEQDVAWGSADPGSPTGITPEMANEIPIEE